MGSGFQYPLVCSQECLEGARDAYAMISPYGGPAELFPLLRGINIHAETFGGCRSENWTQVLAHAHNEDGIICVRGPVNGLVEGGGNPTSLLLHEYAHLLVPSGHTEEFWTENKRLHADYGVTHKRLVDALGSVFGSVIFVTLGLVLWLVFGWGWLGFGSMIGLLFTVPSLINSFQDEEHETSLRECGTEPMEPG